MGLQYVNTIIGDCNNIFLTRIYTVCRGDSFFDELNVDILLFWLVYNFF